MDPSCNVYNLHCVCAGSPALTIVHVPHILVHPVNVGCSSPYTHDRWRCRCHAGLSIFVKPSVHTCAHKYGVLCTLHTEPLAVQTSWWAPPYFAYPRPNLWSPKGECQQLVPLLLRPIHHWHRRQGGVLAD
jgi:hypothetical protein